MLRKVYKYTMTEESMDTNMYKRSMQMIIRKPFFQKEKKQIQQKKRHSEKKEEYMILNLTSKTDLEERWMRFTINYIMKSIKIKRCSKNGPTMMRNKKAKDWNYKDYKVKKRKMVYQIQ